MREAVDYPVFSPPCLQELLPAVLQTILLALVVGFHQLQAGYLHIQIHTLLDAGISGTQSLDLGKTEGCFVHIIAGTHR